MGNAVVTPGLSSTESDEEDPTPGAAQGYHAQSWPTFLGARAHEDDTFECDCGAPTPDEVLCAECQGLNLNSDANSPPDKWIDLRAAPTAMDPDCTFCQLLESCTIDQNVAWKPQPLKTLKILATKNPSIPATPCLRYKEPSPSNVKSNLYAPVILPVHAGPGLSGRHIDVNEVDYNLIGDWLRWCGEHHHTCNTPRPTSIPGFKTIDVDTMTIVPFHDLRSEYVTLSYVWGSFVDGTLGPGGLPNILPQAVYDAIYVTKKLGLRYLWVDRYCIAQDNPVVKRDQIMRMGEIYSESHLTIIAAAGQDSEYGLPGVSRPRISQTTARIGRLCLIAHTSKDEEIHNSVWNSRGWTFQEGLLAKRRLVFTDSQCYMQCQEVHYHEGIRSPRAFRPSRSSYNNLFRPAFTYPKKKHDRVLASKWINDFLNRNLSFDQDAVDCVAALFRSSSNFQLLCGLPVEQDRPTALDALARSLLWYHSTDLVRRPCFPSWTWAGWKRARTDTRIVSRPLNDGWVSISPETNFDAFPRGSERSVDDCFIHGAQAYFSDGTVLDWDTASMEILERSRLSIYPTCLEITGWVFEAEKVLIPLSSEEDAKKSEWEFSTPPALLSAKAQKDPEHLRQAVSKEKFVGMILMSRLPGLETRTKTAILSVLARQIGFLLLKRTQEGFERAERHVEAVPGATDENMTLDRSTGDLKIPGIEIKRDTVRFI
ncbi:HET-domain-containing protein [Melanomma pulvis-pyrius CBS 109.77]|uniref:HET-domain-containing protein n=1 Tax=Melanomma pulvis-pyrius CBS 109.77 TaxID=1314802 RepID=A0A6A6XBM4_9PLEO|nr:HET-domain-containing protein [Melanomma pulvis-pyrius CBS 109.77]